MSKQRFDIRLKNEQGNECFVIDGSEERHNSEELIQLLRNGIRTETIKAGTIKKDRAFTKYIFDVESFDEKTEEHQNTNNIAQVQVYAEITENKKEQKVEEQVKQKQNNELTKEQANIEAIKQKVEIKKETTNSGKTTNKKQPAATTSKKTTTVSNKTNTSTSKVTTTKKPTVSTTTSTAKKPTNTTINTATSTSKPSTNTTSSTTTKPSTSNSQTTTVTSGRTIKFNNGGVISNIDLEEYVIGVVAAEMPAAFHSEALKAQAVVARTYAMKKASKGITLVNSTSHQVYNSVEQMKAKWGSSYSTYYNKIKNAVNATKGKVLKYNGEYIEALYFSMSNGKTELPTYVWSTNYPYLQVVSSSWDKGLSSAKYTINIASTHFK